MTLEATGKLEEEKSLTEPFERVLHHSYNHRGKRLSKLRGLSPEANIELHYSIEDVFDQVYVFALNAEDAKSLGMAALKFDDCRRINEQLDGITFDAAGVDGYVYLDVADSEEFKGGEFKQPHETGVQAEAWFGAPCGRCPEQEPWPPVDITPDWCNGHTPAVFEPRDTVGRAPTKHPHAAFWALIEGLSGRYDVEHGLIAAAVKEWNEQREIPVLDAALVNGLPDEVRRYIHSLETAFGNCADIHAGEFVQSGKVREYEHWIANHECGETA